jgi:replicative DNA helicase
MAIRPLREVLQKVKEDLYLYQIGEIKPITTGKIFIDEDGPFGGLLPGDKLVIAGSSGGGKSFDLQRVKNHIMDLEAAKNYVWVDYSLEMRLISNVIRDLNQKTGKKKKRILTEEFTGEELDLVKDYFANLEDDRYYIEEDTLSSESLEADLTKFLKQHQDKEAVFISIDHIALMLSEGQKKDAVDSTIEAINRLSKKFKNTYWIILSQLNRDILKRIKDKDVTAMPNRGDLYQSDVIFHIADYIYVSHNPFKLGINAFSRFNTKRYDYLSEHFCEVKGGKASFDTVGKIFYVILKSRESDVFHRDIYIEDIGMSDEEKSKWRDVPEDKGTKSAPPKFEVPVVDFTSAPGSMNKFAGKIKDFE